MPSSYVEITGTVPTSTSSATSGINAGKSIVAQNRLEEERLTKESRQVGRQGGIQIRQSEVGPGMRLPERNSSLSARDNNNSDGQQRSRRENGRAESASKSSGKSSESGPTALVLCGEIANPGRRTGCVQGTELDRPSSKVV